MTSHQIHESLLTPEMASKVVKHYLLPMFKKKAGGYGTSKPPFVVSELQLNQELYAKLQSTEQMVLETEEKLEA